MARGVSKSEPQVVKMNVENERPVIQKMKPSENWEEVEKLAREAESLAIEVQTILNALPPKYNALMDKIHKAYALAPLTDTGLGGSPLSRGRMFHHLKSHLSKNGMTMDYNLYDSSARDFKDYVSEGLRWLTKFSRTN